jgi:hypothetical protein
MPSQRRRTPARQRAARPTLSLLRLPSRRAPLTLLLAALLVALAAAGLGARDAHAGRTFTVAPAPRWAKEVAPGEDSGLAEGDKSGSLFLLDDHQTRVSAGRTERYYRHVKKILSAAGLEQAAEFSLPFEPSYQQLLIHHVRILRAGRSIDALVPSEINVIQQEDEFDQRIYNGQLSAVVFLKDVRVGDCIDYAYSVNGDNPVMGGRFADDIYLADAEPIQRLHMRLLWPTARPLSVRNGGTDLAPAVSATDGVTEYVWERERVAGVNFEDSTPGWFEAVPHVQLSEFATWNEVARWAAPLYEVGDLSPALRDKIEELRAASDDPARRLTAALRFAQDEVRYLGIELGSYSHQPSQPSKVLARRFGDCKDKSLLLATILRGLGVEAQLALVNTGARRALDSAQPSPYAFDHVIVRATLAGRTYWLDPTVTHQRGRLDAYYPPPFERALVIDNAAAALETIPAFEPTRPTTVVEETYTVNGADSSAAFEVTTTYLGPDADDFRYQLSRGTANDLARQYLNYYSDNDPSIKADGPPQIADDEEANTIVVRERYTVPAFWADGRRELWADRVRAELSKPSVARREAPLVVSHPKHVRQTIEVRLPEPLDVREESETIANGALSLSYGVSRRGSVIRMEYTLRSLADHVPAAEATRYLEDVGRMQRVVGYELTNAARPFGIGPSAPDSLRLPQLLAGALVVLLVPAAGLVVVAVWAVRRRREREWARPSEWAPSLRIVGADPSSAIRVGEEEEIVGHLRGWRSACGRGFYRDGEALGGEGLSYDGQRLLLVRLRCEACGDAREAYFVRPLAEATPSPAPAG